MCGNLLEDCSLLTAPWCCSKLAVPGRREAPGELRHEHEDQDRVHRQCAPLLSPSQHHMQMAIKICLLHQNSCRKAAENEAYGFVELEGKLSLLIFASALFQSHAERRPYLLVKKEVLIRPQVIPARSVQIKVCRAQSCEN